MANLPLKWLFPCVLRAGKRTKIASGSYFVRAAGLCSNALAFANASANAAFALALAFDSPVTAAFALAFAFESSAFAFALAFDSNAFDLIKCETNANQMPLYYCCFIMVILLVGFFWNKPQADQYKNL